MPQNFRLKIKHRDLKNLNVFENLQILLREQSPKNYNLKVYSKTKCEPFLSKRNLYRDISKSLLTQTEFIMFNLLYYGDGIDVYNISRIIEAKPKDVYNVALLLKKNKLINLKIN